MLRVLVPEPVPVTHAQKLVQQDPVEQLSGSVRRRLQHPAREQVHIVQSASGTISGRLVEIFEGVNSLCKVILLHISLLI